MNTIRDKVNSSLSDLMYNLKLKENISSSDEDDAYNMNHPRRGLAVIFNHKEFVASLCVKKREGTEADCVSLQNTLTKLRFKVIVHHDLTYKELDTVLEEVSNYNFIDCDCLLIAVLSHGEQNVIYSQNRKYSTNVLFERFSADRCPTLARKPKIYVIQACRGKRLDSGFNVEGNKGTLSGKTKMYENQVTQEKKVDPSFDTQVDGGGFQFYQIPMPLPADFLVAFSTIPNHYSWRNKKKGAWFIQAFCDEVNKHWKNHDFLTILTFVNRRVAIDFESYDPDESNFHRKKQIPCINSTLTKLVKFGKLEYYSNNTV